jgi:LmbE family N-acetylglucosaminyl deacetylase
MSNDVLVVAPHPDDETLGCGGALLRHRALGDSVSWLIVTGMKKELGFTPERISARCKEIESVKTAYGFSNLYNLNFPTSRLDTLPTAEVVSSIARIFETVKPSIVYSPFAGDVHTDHKLVSAAVLSCTKWFRFPSVLRVLAYETLSETEFGFNGADGSFIPNVFVDITAQLDRKIEVMQIYASELNKHPFPRSEENVRALALLRGASAGCTAAEAFVLIKEISK